MPIPPPPPGFKLVSGAPASAGARPDPLKLLEAAGFKWTNGFRTPADTQRIRDQGYKPARNSLHLDGDAVDLTHPTLSPAQQAAKLNEMFADWEGYRVLDEGHHRHLQLPKWGAAPGTPGTPNSGLPDLPPGYELERRGSLEPGNFVTADEKAARIATINQGDWSPQERARLISNIQNEQAPLVSTATYGRAFFDEIPEGLASKLSPQQVAAYQAIARNPKSTPQDIEAYFKAQGYDTLNAEEVVKARNAGGGVNEDIAYRPRDPVSLGDGATGAAARGVADPFNVLDETGAAFDTLGLTQGRENIWNSDRPLLDVLYSNIDANRSILDADERDHFEARFGGQLASSLVLPFGNKARGAAQIAKIGGLEGLAAGFGAGEGGFVDRLPNAGVGAALGTIGGYSLGRVIDDAGPMVNRAFRGDREGMAPVAMESAYNTAPLVNDTMQNVGPTPAAKTQPQGGVMGNGAVAAMRSDITAPTLRGPAAPANINAVTPPAAPLSRQQIVESNQMASQLYDAWRLGRVEPDADMLAKIDNTIADQERAFASGEIPDDLKADAEGTLAFLREIRGSDGMAARQPDYINVNDLPPLPSGYVLADDVPLGRVRPMGEQASPEELAARARSMRPEDVRPVPGNRPESLDEMPSSLAALEGPGSPGRRPKRPAGFVDYLRGSLEAESAQRGIAVRIDAEDAIDKGVPAELIYVNPKEANKARLRLRNPSLFGTRYGKMTGEQQALKSLDMDDLDPVEWGFDDLAGGRLDPEDVGDLLRRDLEGDPSALRRGEAFDNWSAYQERAAQRDEFKSRFPDAPPVERLGDPVTLDDVRAISDEIPAYAYEDLPKIGARIGNIDTSKLDTPRAIERAMKNLESTMGGFDAARRGKISHGETEALAREMGMTVDSLLAARKGRAFNAEEATAARIMLAKSYDELAVMANKFSEGASDEELASFHRAILRTAAVHEKVSAATAEAGRALQAFKIPASSKAISGRIHEAVLHGAGGRDRLEDIAKNIIELQEIGAGPGDVTKYAMGAVKPRWRDYAVEYYYNALLSGVSTHVVNTVSNLATQLAQVPEHLVASAIGTVRRPFAKSAGDRVLLSEVGARAMGMIQGAKEGMAAFGKVMRTGDPTDPLTKIEAVRHKAIPGVAGSILRTPTRLLMAEDEFFKATARRSALSGLAVRRASTEGLRGEAATKRAAELIANPPDDLLKQSFDYARYLTFQSPLGNFGNSLTRATEAVPLLKLVVPFIRTPINLFKFSLERVPGAQLLLKRVRDDYKAGGARRDLAVAKAMFGAGVGATAMLAAGEGKITGSGPPDAGTRAMMMANGWKPFSVKVGDAYYSYSRLDPFATLLGTAADLATFADKLTPAQREKSFTMLTAAITSQVESKTWLSGLTDFLQALDDPDRFLEAYGSRLAGSVAVPTIVAHSARAIDPVLREARGPVETIKSRLPGMSKDLPARRDVWGQPIRGEGGPLYTMTSPVYKSSVKHDPLSEDALSFGGRIGKPKRTIGIGEGEDRIERKLTGREFSAYQALAGRYMREDFEAARQHPDWKIMDSREKQKALKDIAKDARQAARDELFGGVVGPPPPPGFQLAQ